MYDEIISPWIINGTAKKNESVFGKFMLCMTHHLPITVIEQEMIFCQLGLRLGIYAT